MTLIEQNFEMFGGDTQDLAMTVYNTDGSIKDLTDATISWALYNEATLQIYLTKSTSSSGVTIIDAKAGTMKVSILPADTQDLRAGPWYKYQTVVIDAGTNVSTINSGHIQILENII